MVITYDGKRMKVDDKYIKTLEKNLNLTTQQAIKVFLEEEGYITDNEEYNKMLKKGTAEMSTVKSKSTKGTKKSSERKKDTEKEALITDIAELLKSLENTTVKIVNLNNEIQLIVNGIDYKMKISKTRIKKD